MALKRNKTIPNPYHRKTVVQTIRNPIAKEMEKVLDEIEKIESKKKSRIRLFKQI